MSKRWMAFFLLWIAILLVGPAGAQPTCHGVMEAPAKTWGANLLRHYTPFSFAHQPITLGVEVEAVLPEKVTSKEFMQVVEEAVHEADPDIRIEYDTSTELSLWKGRRRMTLNLKTDHSIRPDKDWQGIEVESPILQGPEDVKLFFHVVKRLRQRAGMRADPLSAGVHVHVGFPDATGAELMFLANLFSAIEEDLYRFFAVAFAREEYTRRLGGAYTEAFDLRYETPQEYFDARKHLAKRERGLNLVALEDHGTVEFRLFNSTLNTWLIELMMDFAGKTVRAVREQDPRLIQFLSRYDESCQLPLKGLAKALVMGIYTHPYAKALIQGEQYKRIVQKAVREKIEGVGYKINACRVDMMEQGHTGWIDYLKWLAQNRLHR